AHPRLPAARERRVRARTPRRVRVTGHRRGGRLPRRAGDRADHGGHGRPDPPGARLDRHRSPAGAARVSLLVLLAVPLIGALLLTGLGPRARPAMHLTTAGLTLVAAAGLVAAVARSGAVT